MRSSEIQRLLDAVEFAYGPIALYHSDENEEHGTSFLIEGIPASFSVITLEGSLPPDQFDIQVDSQPPGYYIFNPERPLSLDEFLQTIAIFKLPKEQWPGYLRVTGQHPQDILY
ncbi:hypothetical protein [Roseovarius pacificus]|uniref:hypothetical protein n=1 Tax=Roseovarius pacificus TaxID=337701 RepID=UPI002A18DF41|nr:hypothetical protein [Roseovarius pacificus]